MILVLNCGSQSIKWKLFADNLKLKREGKKEVFSFREYPKILLKELNKLDEYQEEIKLVGHRFVHGGPDFLKPLIVTEANLKKLSESDKLAPLHNPFNVLGIKSSQKVFPKARQVAVFDTEFYSKLPEKSYIFPLPEKLRESYGFKRFGFHGISHEYAAKEGAKIIRKNLKNLKIISCHLGGGTSVTATKNGRAIDTSMGYSPMEGLVMMTRSGSIDPAVILELSKDFGASKASDILNFESGLKGISGEDNMLGILKKAGKGDKRSKLALEVYVFQIKKYIGAYFAILEGCDLLVFTGTIGWGSSKIRNMICKNLGILKNTRVIPIKADEESAIAKKIKNLSS
jgi:acetate kinase